MNLDLTPEFESLRFDFLSICERFESAETHQEKVELVALAKEIAREARKKLTEHRAGLEA